jgi:hypothetical protein
LGNNGIYTPNFAEHSPQAVGGHHTQKKVNTCFWIRFALLCFDLYTAVFYKLYRNGVSGSLLAISDKTTDTHFVRAVASFESSFSYLFTNFKTILKPRLLLDPRKLGSEL